MAQDYQEGAVAEDGKGSFMVYRGGLWHPSNDKGYPLERIARPDYGDRYHQQPNGDIVREGPRGGFEVIERAGGGGGAQALVGADARARFMTGLGPLQEAQRNLAGSTEQGNPLNRDWGAALIDNMTEVPFLRNIGDSAARVIGGEDYQKYAQAASTYESALLPILSGAAVTPSEASRLIRADLPQIGDASDVLKRKARNRAMRINAIAQGIGQPPPYDLNNLSSENEERAIAAIAAAQPVGGAPAAPSGPNAPQPGDVRVTQQPLAPEDTPESLRAQGYVYDPARDTWSRTRQEVVTPQEAVAARREDDSLVRKADAAVRGAADTLTFGLADEIAAGANTLLPLDRGSVSGFTRGFGDAFRQNLDLQRGIDRADEEQEGGMRLTGQVGGGLMVLPRLVGQGAARGAVGLGRQTLRSIGQGAGYGGAYGFGSAEGDVLERAPNAITGAATGAAVGAVAPVAGNALGRTVVEPVARMAGGLTRFGVRQAGRAATALGVPGAERVVEAAAPNALRSGVSRMADRMGERRVNALRPEMSRQADLGMEPTFVDIADDASVGRVRALGSRDIEGRDELVGFAEGRRARLPSRARRIAEEEISPDQRPTPEVIDDLARTRRTNGDMIQGFGRDPVRLDENTAQALQGPVARQALRDAAARAASSLDPEERAAAPLLEALATGRASAVELTVRDVQDISAALRKSADSAFRNSPADGPVLSGLGNAIRQAGRDQSDGYATWLQKYADDSSLLESATTGRNFVAVSNDPASARSTQAFVRNAENATEPEMAIQRQASGQAMQAAASNPKGARGVLDNMAFDVDQQARARAIGVDADRLAQRSEAEVRAVTQAQRASPRIGSESSLNLQDAGDAAGLMGAVRRPVTAAAGAIMNRVRARGFNNDEADAVIRAAIDPNRTQEVIDILSQRMTRREARSLARVIRRQVTIGLQSNQQQ